MTWIDDGFNLNGEGTVSPFKHIAEVSVYFILSAIYFNWKKIINFEIKLKLKFWKI